MLRIDRVVAMNSNPQAKFLCARESVAKAFKNTKLLSLQFKCKIVFVKVFLIRNANVCV